MWKIKLCNFLFALLPIEVLLGNKKNGGRYTKYMHVYKMRKPPFDVQTAEKTEYQECWKFWMKWLIKRSAVNPPSRPLVYFGNVFVVATIWSIYFWIRWNDGCCYESWQRRIDIEKDDKVRRHIAKEKMICLSHELVSRFLSNAVAFYMINRGYWLHQANDMKKLNKSLSAEDMVVSIDFAEN